MLASTWHAPTQNSLSPAMGGRGYRSGPLSHAESTCPTIKGSISQDTVGRTMRWESQYAPLQFSDVLLSVGRNVGRRGSAADLSEISLVTLDEHLLCSTMIRAEDSGGPGW